MNAQRRKSEPPPTPQRMRPPKFLLPVQTWLLRHAQAALGALGRFLSAPLAAVTSVMLVAVAAALPALLYLLVENAERLVASWEGTGSLTVFLKSEVSDDAARKLARQVEKHADVEVVQVIGRKEGLAEFRRLSGFGAALDALGENPFPAVLAVRARPSAAEAGRMAALAQELGKLPEAEVAQFDLDWVKRLLGFTALAERATWVLAMLLAAGVLFVIGNTLRLEIQARRAEIEITALVGGTAGFIRRPFLYWGFWLGLLGGLLGWLLGLVALASLDGPASYLATLFGSGFTLSGGGPGLFAAMTGGGALLGLAGAWLAVLRMLDVAQPE
jgi:cell division transport system permease protein